MKLWHLCSRDCQALDIQAVLSLSLSMYTRYQIPLPVLASFSPFLFLFLSLTLEAGSHPPTSKNLPEECSLDFTSIKVNQEECDASRKKVPVVQLASKLRSKRVLDNFGWPSPKRTRCSGGWCFWSSEWRGRGTVEQRITGSYNYQENAE